MRGGLDGRDARATVFVAAAAAVYGLWSTETALSGMSTRVVGAIVFALGYAACMSDSAEMARVFGAEAGYRPPLAYTVLTSLLGAVALAFAALTLVTASEPALAITVAAMVILWVVTTVRHAFFRVPDHDDDVASAKLEEVEHSSR